MPHSLPEPARTISRIGILEKRGKTLDGGLPELRALLANAGHPDPLWISVDKGRKVAGAARDLLDQGADRILVWGGDGTLQHAFAAVAGTHVAVGVLPAGTGNVFATNLGIPTGLADAVAVALGPDTVRVDLGVVDDELFGVMAGVGFDAMLVKAADKSSKGRFGRSAYLLQAVRAAARVEPVHARVKVDGQPWFDGDVTAVLVANAGRLMGGVRAFPDARMDDGVLEVGVVKASGLLQWARLGLRIAAGSAARSPLAEVGRGQKITVKLGRPVPYELDGGDRKKVDRLQVRVNPRAVEICVPARTAASAPRPHDVVVGGNEAAVAQTVSGS